MRSTQNQVETQQPASSLDANRRTRCAASGPRVRYQAKIEKSGTGERPGTEATDAGRERRGDIADRPGRRFNARRTVERTGEAGGALGVAGGLRRGLSSLERVTAQTRPPQVQSVRLYVLDCGVLVRGEPTAYGLTREQVGETNFSDACYLVVHPKGTLLWDVGIIPDSQIKPGGIEFQPAVAATATAPRRPW